jgi:1,4-alpha-glucan branching enzyme
MTSGNVAIVLNAHFPYVRHGGRWPHGEDALLAVIAESYVPLLAMLLDHQRAHGALPLTLGISPVLLEQLADPHVMQDVGAWIAAWRARAERDFEHFVVNDDRHSTYLARFYGDWIDGVAHTFGERFAGNVLGAVRNALSANVDLLLAPATYAYLPHLSLPAARAQLKTGAQPVVRHLGRRPDGLWLPGGGMGGGDRALANELGLRYAVTPQQPRGQAEQNDLPLFVADGALAEHVTAPAMGYPGDGVYREFYRHHPKSGIAYWRVTGIDVPLDQKAPYDPYLAFSRADEHAAHWVQAVVQRLAELAEHEQSPALVLAFDAELFGHWWFEGIHWLRRVLQHLEERDDITLTSVSHLPPPPAAPAVTSSAHPLFDDPTLAPMQQRIVQATERFVAMAERCGAVDEDQAALLTQAARELLLAQGSDWAALIATGAATDYAERRVREHVERLDHLLHWAETAPTSAEAVRYLQNVTAQDNVFPFLNYRVFA